jgi:hypothetical protein
MATCKWCGKYISDGAVRAYDGQFAIAGPFCGQKCLKEWEAQTYGTGSAADNSAAEAAAAAAQREAAEAMARASQEAAERQEEADKKAAARQAWPPFEEKYAGYFTGDIPDWFVERYFELDLARGRYVVEYRQEELDKLLALAGALNGIPGNFKGNYWYGRLAENTEEQWFSRAVLLARRDAALKRLQDGTGMVFEPMDNSISLATDIINLDLGALNIRSSNWFLYDSGSFAFQPPALFCPVYENPYDNSGEWQSSMWNEPGDIAPFKTLADSLEKTLTEVDWSLYTYYSSTEHLYERKLIIRCLLAKVLLHYSQEQYLSIDKIIQMSALSWDNVESGGFERSPDEEILWGWTIKEEGYAYAFPRNDYGYLSDGITPEEVGAIAESIRSLGLGDEDPPEEQCVAYVRQAPGSLTMFNQWTKAMLVAAGILAEPAAELKPERPSNNAPKDTAAQLAAAGKEAASLLAQAGKGFLKGLFKK